MDIGQCLRVCTSAQPDYQFASAHLHRMPYPSFVGIDAPREMEAHLKGVAGAPKQTERKIVRGREAHAR